MKNADVDESTEVLSKDRTKEIEERVTLLKNQMAAIETFRESCLKHLKILYETTDPTIVQSVNSEFLQAIADTGLSFEEAGKLYKEKLNESFQNVLEQIPHNCYVEADSRNLFAAVILNIFEPIENFLKSDEKRKEALMHLNFINMTLRSMKVRYEGCKQQWDAEDEALKALRSA